MDDVTNEPPSKGEVVLRGGPFDGTTISNQADVAIVEAEVDGESARYQRTEDFEQLRGAGLRQPYRRWRVYEWVDGAR